MANRYRLNISNKEKKCYPNNVFVEKTLNPKRPLT